MPILYISKGGEDFCFWKPVCNILKKKDWKWVLEKKIFHHFVWPGSRPWKEYHTAPKSTANCGIEYMVFFDCEILKKNEISMNKKHATEGLSNKSYDLSMGHFRIILKQCAWKEPGNFLGYPGASFPMDLWLLLLIESNHRQELDRI